MTAEGGEGVDPGEHFRPEPVDVHGHGRKRLKSIGELQSKSGETPAHRRIFWIAIGVGLNM
jgi:hypothetical protein